MDRTFVVDCTSCLKGKKALTMEELQGWLHFDLQKVAKCIEIECKCRLVFVEE